jgi:DNA-binding XRE family transcriptional regulator
MSEKRRDMEERRDTLVEGAGDKLTVSLVGGPLDKLINKDPIEVEVRRDATRLVGPSPEDMIDSAEIDEPVPHGQFVELTGLVHDLKARRATLGLSLADVAERSRLTRAAVSRLENGWNLNPTLETLYRYALALDANVRLVAEEIPVDEGSPADD